MKNNYGKFKLATLLACVYSFTSSAQITPVRLQQFITAGKYNTEVKSFYTLVNYETACIQSKDFASLSFFFNVLQHCDSMVSAKMITSLPL